MPDFDENLAAAVAVAALEPPRSDSSDEPDGLGLDRRGFTLARHAAGRKGTHPVLANTGPGQLLQLNTFNQFHPLFAPLIRAYQTPGAICGFASMAGALLCSAALARLPGGRITTVRQLKDLEARMRDARTMLPLVRAAMQHVHDARLRYVRAHADTHFRSGKQARAYMAAWVANYEVSDFFRDVRRRGSADVRGVAFIRFNQASEIGAATHEERRRLLREEMRYAAQHRQEKDKGDEAAFRPGDVVFLAEGFAPQRRLRTPEEFVREVAATTAAAAVVGGGGAKRAAEEKKEEVKAEEEQQQDTGGEAVQGSKRARPSRGSLAAAANMDSAGAEGPCAPSVYVLDLNGHFCVAVPAAIDGKRLLVLFNTTNASYLEGAGALVSAMAFDVSFPPQAALRGADAATAREQRSLLPAAAAGNVDTLSWPNGLRGCET